jgi:5-methylcytosine-specific restriction endonuclease McrA
MDESLKMSKNTRYIQKSVKDKVRQRDKNKCRICGKSSEYMEFDHLTPYSKGAPATVENIQLLCRKCNLEKRNKTPKCEKCKDWIPYGAKFCQNCGATQKTVVNNYGSEKHQKTSIYKFIGWGLILFSLYLILKGG